MSPGWAIAETKGHARGEQVKYHLGIRWRHSWAVVGPALMVYVSRVADVRGRVAHRLGEPAMVGLLGGRHDDRWRVVVGRILGRTGRRG